MQNFLVDEASRLDIFVAKITQQSRSSVASLIKNNCVCVNEIIQNKNSLRLKVGDTLTLLPPSPQKPSAKYAAHFEVGVLFEDEDILVLNKPSALVVHPAPSVKEPTLVDWLIQRRYTLSNLGGEFRAGLVHRLDKETSGAIIIAKNNPSHRDLSLQLQDKSLGRIYLALIDLPLKETKMVVDKPLVRCPSNRIKKMAIEGCVRGAKEAKSAFVSLCSGSQTHLIAAKLFSGRTHQIRAHLASLNRHILGDELYGYRGGGDLRIMLHAYFISFIHPKTREKIHIKAPLMSDFKQILEKKLSLGEDDEKISLHSLLDLFDF
ncbi:RluA family pseudouridine synthase [Campylobacter sp.]|uniref:RluA family pseudouridine synthase n=1 Tax=Campylobacter sp. TaxID=205 RepID=UPI0026DC4A68|nr:RluA family pseudouridine synthase [Campylobacter sp.]MDO4674591.1 RluA family pseudouridine synthase [Campylobacter sp.]